MSRKKRISLRILQIILIALWLSIGGLAIFTVLICLIMINLTGMVGGLQLYVLAVIVYKIEGYLRSKFSEKEGEQCVS